MDIQSPLELFPGFKNKFMASANDINALNERFVQLNAGSLPMPASPENLRVIEIQKAIPAAMNTFAPVYLPLAGREALEKQIIVPDAEAWTRVALLDINMENVPHDSFRRALSEYIDVLVVGVILPSSPGPSDPSSPLQMKLLSAAHTGHAVFVLEKK